MEKLWPVVAAFRSWLRIQRPRLMSGFVRAILWGSAVAVALWPSMHLSHAPWTFDINYVSKIVNSAGHFRDFFFITIVISIIGLANIFDNMATSFRHGHKIGDLSFICFSILGVVFMGTLFYSLPQFIEIAQSNDFLNPEILNRDSDIVRNTILAGIAAELVIAMRERPNQISA
jgi:hypothetical protein